jgi:carbon storage regulator
MLVLSRKVGESVVIGEDVYLTILGISGNKLELGFDAPKSLTIHREEIHARNLNKNASVSTDDLKTGETIIDRLIAKFKRAEPHISVNY